MRQSVQDYDCMEELGNARDLRLAHVLNRWSLEFEVSRAEASTQSFWNHFLRGLIRAKLTGSRRELCLTVSIEYEALIKGMAKRLAGSIVSRDY